MSQTVQVDSARLLTPSRSPTSPNSPGSPTSPTTPKRSKKKQQHNFIVPTISVTTPPSDDGHGRYDDDDDEPLARRPIRSNSLKRAQKQISEAQYILGDNIANLDEKHRTDSLGEGTVSFRHISGSRRKNGMLLLVSITFGVIVALVLLVIGIMAAVNRGSPF